MTRGPVAPPVTGPLQKAALREFDRCMRSVESGGDPEFWKRRIGLWLYDLKRAVYQCERALEWLEERRTKGVRR